MIPIFPDKEGRLFEDAGYPDVAGNARLRLLQAHIAPILAWPLQKASLTQHFVKKLLILKTTYPKQSPF